MGDDLNIKSSGETYDGKKTAAQREKLEKIKEKQAADKSAAAEKRAAAGKSTAAEKGTATGETKGDFNTQLGKLGGVLIDNLIPESAEEKSAGNRKQTGTSKRETKGTASNPKSQTGWKKWLITILIIAVIAVVCLVVIPRLTGSHKTTSSTDMNSGSSLVSTKIDFNNAILTEARQEQQLVVWEQDVKVTSEISSALAGLDIFKKTKSVTSYGTGVYAVDMSQITDDSIAVDDSAKTVTISIPRTQLRYITKDLDKTEFEDTDHAIFAFGDIKLTEEQQNILEQSIEDAMRTELVKEDSYKTADDAALLMVYDTYQPVVAKLSNEYTLDIVFDEATSNVDDSKGATEGAAK